MRLLNKSSWGIWNITHEMRCMECECRLLPGFQAIAFSSLGFPVVCSEQCRAIIHDKLEQVLGTVDGKTKDDF